MSNLADVPVGFSAVEARSRLDEVKLLYSELSGMASILNERKAELTNQVAIAKAREELAPRVDAILEEIKRRTHQKTVGVFENLLTAIVQDVFPEKPPVKLVLGTSHSAPSLNIFLRGEHPKDEVEVTAEASDDAAPDDVPVFAEVDPEDEDEDDEDLEDVLEDTGGAITNVLSTGLRYIALSRTKNRRFMVLDEPDCWVKPDRVPAFIKVITDVAKSTNTQTLLISHHSAEYFEGDVNLIHLTKNVDGKIEAVELDSSTPDWNDDEEPGWRWIELINIKRHEHTFIKLKPGVNALIGDNDYGKSSAFRAAPQALCYGVMTNSLIRRKQAFGTIRVGLEKGYVLEMTRKRKGSPKVAYTLFQNGEQKNQSRKHKPGTVPDFVSELLQVNRVDGLDIHLLNQKKPVFLLDQPDTTQAKILSVGRESGFLHSMMLLQRKWLAKDRETIRDGEAELARIQRRLNVLNDLTGVGPVLTMMGQLLGEVENAEKARVSVQNTIDRIQRLSAEVRRFDRLLAVTRQLPEEPVLYDPTSLNRMIARIEKASTIVNIKLPEAIPEEPALFDNQPLFAMGKRLAGLHKLLEATAALPSKLPDEPAIDVNFVPSVNKTIDKLAKLREQEKAAKAKAELLSRQLENLEIDYEVLKEEAGGVCPLCDAPFTEHTH